MSLAREGLVAMALTGTVSATVIATSVWRRNWTLWLLGYALLLVTALIALTSSVQAARRTDGATLAAGFTGWRVAPRPIDVVAASMSPRLAR